ncbi:MAG TPA: tRNA pseudouridine(13) synthase TruD [Nitrososphaeraceae archaeon]
MLRNVPKIDTSVGIRIYATHYPGTGGIIKEKAGDFKVTEVIHNSILNSIVPVSSEKNEFPLFCLEKSGLDSSHALLEIKKELGMNLRLLGIKDSKAITRQYCTCDQNIKFKSATTTHTSLSLLGFTSQSLRKSHLVGNEFKILVRDMNTRDLLNFSEEVNRIPNFYGLQRFGSARGVTHLVGREILKKNFRGAVDMLLSYTTEYDTRFSRELRESCKDPTQYASVLKKIPHGMDIERLILISLLNGKNYISAIRSIPVNTRRLFVHAYQAFLFNECISSLIEEGQEILQCTSGDFCFHLEEQYVLGKLRKFSNGVNHDNIVPAMQLAGYSLRNRDGRFEKELLKIMMEEGLSPKDFYIKELQELSAEGGFRQLPLMVSGFRFNQNNEFKFMLPVGAYATTLLRELIKPINPIKAGF